MPIYDIADFKYLGSESDFYANTFAEHLLQHEHMVLAPHRHGFYLSVLFTRGNGIHEVDFQTFGHTMARRHFSFVTWPVYIMWKGVRRYRRLYYFP